MQTRSYLVGLVVEECDCYHFDQLQIRIVSKHREAQRTFDYSQEVTELSLFEFSVVVWLEL